MPDALDLRYRDRMEARDADEMSDVRMVEQRQVDQAFETRRVVNIKVIQRALKEWYFTFQMPHPETGELETYAQGTTRKTWRSWSDPRNLFGYLHKRYGVSSGAFTLLNDEGTADAANSKEGARRARVRPGRRGGPRR